MRSRYCYPRTQQNSGVLQWYLEGVKIHLKFIGVKRLDPCEESSTPIPQSWSQSSMEKSPKIKRQEKENYLQKYMRYQISFYLSFIRRKCTIFFSEL